MVGTIIGAATALASAIGGGIASAVKNRQAAKLISDQRQKNKEWYEMETASDYTQRSDAQAILKKQRQLLDEQYARAKATSVVAGGTDEALALQQRAANDNMADTMTNIASEAAAHRDSVSREYRQNDTAFNQQQAQIKANEAANVARAAGQAVNAGLNLIGTDINSPDGSGSKAKAAPAPQQPVVTPTAQPAPVNPAQQQLADAGITPDSVKGTVDSVVNGQLPWKKNR